MEYNKNRFQKTNDKKVLHKVKKQWVVLSLSLLAALGGGALASHVTTHADTTNNNNQTSTQASTLKSRLNQSLIQNQSRQPSQSQAQAPQTSTKSITNQANVLHNRIVNNTVSQHLDQSQVKNNASGNQANVLKQRMDVPQPQVGAGSVAVNFLDNEFTNGSNVQPSVVSSANENNGITYSQLASKVPSGYAMDALSSGINFNSAISSASGSANIEISPKDPTPLTVNNIQYEADFKNSNGSAQQTYNAGSAASAVSYGDNVSGWTASAGSSAVISAGNASNYITVPSGYQMSGSYTITMTPTGIQWTDGQGNIVASPKFTFIPKTSASAITVHLIDHSGYQVSMSGSNGITASNGVSASISSGDLVFSGSGDFGNTIDVLQSAINSNGNLPSGYSLSSGQYSDYTFGSTAQTVNAIVNAPVASNASVTIKSTEYNHENSATSSNSSAYNLRSLVASNKASVNDSDVREGDIVTINPGAFAASGYNTPSSDYTQSDYDRVYVGDDGNLYQAPLDSAGGAAPSSKVPSPIKFNYTENDTTASDADLPTVNVTYIDQNGKKIVTNSSANIQPSDYGKTIDLTQPNDNKGGVAVPQGYDLNYSLDDNDATKFTVDVDNNNNGQPINKTFYLIGKNVTTNDTKANNHKLGTYTLPIKIQTEKSDNGSASVDSKFSDSGNNGIFTPNIQGRVGDSMIVSPSDFLDDGQLSAKDNDLNSTNYGLDPNDKQYRITFGSNGNLTVGQIDPSDANDSSRDSNVTNLQPSNTGVVFTYAGNKNGGNKSQKKRTTIRVNYLYQDQNYLKSNKTPSQKWIQIPGTTVSDYGQQSDPYNTKDSNGKYTYLDNIPKGYQFVKILNINPKASDNAHKNNFHNGDNINAYDENTSDKDLSSNLPNKFGSDDQTVNIAVIPTAGNITVQYYNQNGEALKSDGTISTNPVSDTISGNSSSKGNKTYYSRYGQKLNITDGNNNPMDDQGNSYGLKNIPKGYHLVQNPTTTPAQGYQFTRQNQTIKLTVVGNNVTQNSENNKVNFKIHKVAGNGKKADNSSSATVYPKGRIGNTSYLDPNDYAPAGYHATPSDQPWSVNFTPGGQAQHNNLDVGGNNVPNWSYIANTPDQNPFYFNVTYVNKDNGQAVSGQDRINGFYGENISDVSHYAGVPLGYKVDGGPYSYKLGFGPAAKNGGNVDIPVSGADESNQSVGNLKFTVYRIYKGDNGQERISDESHTLNEWHSINHNINASQIGGTFTVKPSDYTPTPSTRYSVDKADVPETVQVLPNGSNGSILSTDQAVFYYDDNRSGSTDQAAPIIVHYINEKTGRQVGTNDLINGKYNNGKININDGKISGANDPDANWNVPDGYTATDPSDTISNGLTFGSDVQNVYLPVKGQKVSDTINVAQIREDQSGTQLGNINWVQKKLSGNVGDSWTISPYSDVPGQDKYSSNGYHADNSDDDVNVTLGTNGHILLNGIDHLTNNNSYGISYVYRKNSSATVNDTLDTITIHYQDVNNKGTDLDTEYDHGTTGKKFDITPYTNDIPSNVNGKYYQYNSDNLNNVTAFASGKPTVNGQPNNQDVYIYVNKNSDSTHPTNQY